ncbi:hypothetical protein MUK42_32645 [Musa troglodytarum]|nr:hypothetical protein MUK42_32645 [Musa troglodytarum]
MRAKSIRATGPAIQPSCAIAHAKDSTPEPMTAVTICELAVHTVPAHYAVAVRIPGKAFGGADQTPTFLQLCV